MSDVVTPVQVERRLVALSKELDEAHQVLSDAEHLHMTTVTAYELAAAKNRMRFRQSGVERGVKLTVQEIDDCALRECRDELTDKNVAEAVVKSARANVQRIRTQIDIARSIGTLVRAGMDM